MFTEAEMKDNMNKIHNIDCLEFMKQVPDDYFDLVLTSPPYDDIKKYGGFSFDFKGIAIELHRILKVGGAIIWNVADQTKNGSESGTSFRQALFFMDIGLRLHDTMIYRKTNYPPMTHNRYEQEFEYIFCFSKGRPKTFNPIMIKCKHSGISTFRSFYKTDSDELTRTEKSKIKETKIRGNVFDYVVGGAITGKYKHPAMMPPKLAEDQISTWSNIGDKVFDPFMGSGTTAVVCQSLGLKWCGCELESDYVEIANKRLSKVQGSLF